MAENEKPAAPDPLSAEERAHFESRGEREIPPPAAEPAAPAAVPAPEKPRDVIDVASAPAEKPQPTTVPLTALQEERKRRQESDEKVRQIELLNARMEERFRAFRDAVAPRPGAAAEPPPPTVDQDIFGAVKHLQQETTRTRSEIENYKSQIQREDEFKRLRQWGADTEAQFVKTNPDYYQALSALRQARARELEVWGLSPSAVMQQLGQEETQLLARAAAERRNPAEMAYSLAKQRGYQRQAAPSSSQPQPQPPSSTRHEVDLNRIEQGQRQSGSLSNVGGGAGREVGDVEIDDLLKMSDREFGAFIEKYPQRFRRLKGAAH